MKTRALAWFAIACLTPDTLANPAPKAPTSEEIRLAVRDLDSEQFKVRKAAARKLIFAGKNAIEPLVEAANAASLTTADRAVKLLEELAFQGAEENRPPARDALHRLAQSKSQASAQAREILIRQRGLVIDQMQKAGVTFQFTDDRVRAIYLDRVADLKSVLPLLREFPETEEVSAPLKAFGDGEFKALLPLKKLKWINLFESNIGDESLKLLKHFPDLESIPMGRTQITDDGLKHVANLKGLEYLGLRGNNISDAGLVHVRGMTNLTGLTLQETKVTDAGLANLKEMKKLSHLRLQTTTITDAGLEKLHDLKSLRQVDLAETKVTAQGIEKLRKAIPEAAISGRESE